MKRLVFLLLIASGAAGAWLWWQRRLDAQQQDVWSQVMAPGSEPEPAPVLEPAVKPTSAPRPAKASPKKAAAKKASAPPA